LHSSLAQPIGLPHCQPAPSLRQKSRQKFKPFGLKDEPQVRVVTDTNTVVSGLLWAGAPRQVLDAARLGQLHLFTTTDLLIELEDVLLRPKFNQRLILAGTSAHELVLGYAALTTLVKPATIAPIILADPDDDAVIACAVAAQAEVIVSGDSHLLDLKQYQDIRIVRAAELLTKIKQ
jgi:uncharacterized protein